MIWRELSGQFKEEASGFVRTRKQLSLFAYSTLRLLSTFFALFMPLFISTPATFPETVSPYLNIIANKICHDWFFMVSTELLVIFFPLE